MFQLRGIRRDDSDETRIVGAERERGRSCNEHARFVLVHHFGRRPGEHVVHGGQERFPSERIPTAVIDVTRGDAAQLYRTIFLALLNISANCRSIATDGLQFNYRNK